MCLAVPAQVISREDQHGVVEMQGLQKKINFQLVPEARPGDFVIIHVGMALSVLDTQEADQILEQLRELSP